MAQDQFFFFDGLGLGFVALVSLDARVSLSLQSPFLDGPFPLTLSIPAFFLNVVQLIPFPFSLPNLAP